MKKMIFLLITVLCSQQFYSQNSSRLEQRNSEIRCVSKAPCSTLKPNKIVCFSVGTLEDLFVNIEAHVPSFRAYQTGAFNRTPILTYRNCIINDVYVDGIKCDPSVLQNLNPNNIESVQVFNSVMESDIYSSSSKI